MIIPNQSSLDSEDDYHSGCRNASYCHQQRYLSGLVGGCRGTGNGFLITCYISVFRHIIVDNNLAEIYFVASIRQVRAFCPLRYQERLLIPLLVCYFKAGSTRKTAHLPGTLSHLVFYFKPFKCLYNKKSKKYQKIKQNISGPRSEV